MTNGFIEKVAEQISDKHSRKLITAELESHLLDKIDYYVDIGYSREEAEKRATDEMGDPDDTAQRPLVAGGGAVKGHGLATAAAAGDGGLGFGRGGTAGHEANVHPLAARGSRAYFAVSAAETTNAGAHHWEARQGYGREDPYDPVLRADRATAGT